MSQESFPLPEVAQALEPFIKPREEVAAVRRSLQRYLQKQLPDDGGRLTSVSLTLPPVTRLETPPSALTGVRKAYWKALQAQAAALANYNALQSEIDQIRQDRIGRNHQNGSHDARSANESYIALLRQREKQRRLKVIDHAFSEISLTGGDLTGTALDDVVRKKIGDLPAPPTAQPSFNHSPEVDSKVMELKKAVIAAKRKVESQQQNSRAHSLVGSKSFSPQAEVAGLQKALQELTIWMDSQLTIIASAEAEPQSNLSSPGRSSSPVKAPLPAEAIEDLYEEYIEARERLVETVNHPPQTSLDQSVTTLDLDERTHRRKASSREATKSLAEVVLPHTPTLVAAKQEEQALVQQAAYLRRHISTAEGETDRLMRRLADESHLVDPGASQAKDWVKAAAESGAATETFVNQRLKAGQESASAAKQALESIQSMPGSLDEMLEKSHE